MVDQDRLCGAGAGSGGVFGGVRAVGLHAGFSDDVQADGHEQICGVEAGDFGGMAESLPVFAVFL